MLHVSTTELDSTANKPPTGYLLRSGIGTLVHKKHAKTVSGHVGKRLAELQFGLLLAVFRAVYLSEGHEGHQQQYVLCILFTDCQKAHQATTKKG